MLDVHACTATRHRIRGCSGEDHHLEVGVGVGEHVAVEGDLADTWPDDGLAVLGVTFDGAFPPKPGKVRVAGQCALDQGGQPRVVGIPSGRAS